MKWLLLQILAVQLCLATTDEDIASEYDMYQKEIIPEFPFQQQREVQLPLLVRGEPVMSPRGRRPASSVSHLTDPIGSNLNDFPPGRPSRSNIGNICKKNRPKTTYGPDNLPQTGFSHLSRQGLAINNIESGFAKCCLQSDKLRCSDGVWKNGLDDFCSEEFTIKTRHYHCCKEKGLNREACFSREAPNPTYSSMPQVGALQEIGSADVPTLGRGRSFRPCSPSSPACQKNSKFQLSDLSFPPGEPKSSNIQNICKLRKLRPFFYPNQMPQSGHGHYVRQAKTINRMENEYKKCCKNDNVACAHTAWEKVLAQFCSQELAVKSRHYECCKKRDRAGMYNCFANDAPYPEYDREVVTMNLSNITAESLETLCGETKLLTKQKQIPLLVSGLKDSCCTAPSDAVLGCVDEQKEKFIEVLCSSKKDSWKDTQNCCSKADAEKEECFDYYVQNVSVAVSRRHKPE
ncbi:extracellular matrix protein 1 [Discoglossus pictus]